VSPHPKDDALPTVTRLRVLVAKPLFILGVLLFWFLERNDWNLWSPSEVQVKRETNGFRFPKRKRVPAVRLAEPSSLESARSERRHPDAPELREPPGAVSAAAETPPLEPSPRPAPPG
jgi:hypothetical protein